MGAGHQPGGRRIPAPSSAEWSSFNAGRCERGSVSSSPASPALRAPASRRGEFKYKNETKHYMTFSRFQLPDDGVSNVLEDRRAAVHPSAPLILAALSKQSRAACQFASPAPSSLTCWALQAASRVHRAAPRSSDPGEVNQRGAAEDGPDQEILVVICAAEDRMGGTIAAINSVYSNTEARLLFYIVTLRDSVSHVRKWIENSELKEIKFKILEFNPMILKSKVRPVSSRPELLHPLNFVRFYLPMLVSEHQKVIYLDDDVIVQGDIQELYRTGLQPGHAAAFASDCDLPSTHEMVRSVGMQTTYMGFLDYRKPEVRELGISPGTCSFNPGVMVANVTEWRRQRITKQLEKWMQQNLRSERRPGAVPEPHPAPPSSPLGEGD
ncbi:GL8D2 protein, partial [Atractosteus spatula]|nr:GL8D2 protein [Atractosteus spatula]